MSARVGATVSSSPLTIAGGVAASYLAWLAVALAQGHGAKDFAIVGQDFLDRASSSPAIEANATHAISGTGYDGQFSLFLAQDPERAHEYMHEASYRYARILYPLAARAIGEVLRVDVAAALVLLNIVAVFLGAWALAAWLERHGSSAWLALLVAFAPGTFVSVARDLSDALAYALVALAVVAFDHRAWWRTLASATLFALALFARETTGVFALVWAGALTLRSPPGERWRKLAAFAALVVAPYVAYRAFLLAWLGEAGFPAQLRPSLVPFDGVTSLAPWDHSELQQIYAFVVPGVFCLFVALWALWRRAGGPEVVALAATAVLYVVLLPEPPYQDFYASSRVALAVMLAFVLALPALRRMMGSTTWVLLPAVAWFSPWWELVPVALL
ncbi:MAG TPA: hypothetical protein VNJ53_03945 [Gaiellaceae bacterium]|nr:hypothetical protein [Gaiellaceae bacterium]